MAEAAGIHLTWNDFADISAVVPLLCRIYPNGPADVNHFHAAGGMGFLIRELLDAGLLHADVTTSWGGGLEAYTAEPVEDGTGGLAWRESPAESHDTKVLRGRKNPFQADGGLKVLEGALGHAVAKISAVAPERRAVEAPVRIFHDQEGLHRAFKAGELDRDLVVVVRFQGPHANGMPELHKLMPPLSVLHDRGHRVALVTDGRLSGASGKVPAALHVTPEAARGGPIARLMDGDIVRVDAVSGRLDVLVDAADFAARPLAEEDLSASHEGVGRELFAAFRERAGLATRGASLFA
jgi:phosphogluconate dehydratase